MAYDPSPGNATKNLTVTVAALAATAGSSFQYQWRLDG
jgi:hypothetical protein